MMKKDERWKEVKIEKKKRLLFVFGKRGCVF